MNLRVYNYLIELSNFNQMVHMVHEAALVYMIFTLDRFVEMIGVETIFVSIDFFRESPITAHSLQQPETLCL
jgi:hypothetical protein